MTYKSYDPSVDYADRLRRMMQAGASAAEVEDVLRKRVEKAQREPGHEQYAYDAYYAAARDYIDRKNRYPDRNRNPDRGSRYTDPYADRLQDALDRLEAQEPFSYDPAQDPAYQAYQQAYRREGDRAARNSLGEAAALTGGQASTAAVAAASQARDYYNSKMGDVIPDLYQLAWQMHQSARQNLVNEVETLANLSASAYAQHQDDRALDYKIFADERAFGYQQYQDVRDREDAAAQSWYDRQLDAEHLAYEKEKNAQSHALAQERNQMTAQKNAYTRAMAFLNAGIMPTDQMLKAAGIDRQQARSYRANALRKRR